MGSTNLHLLTLLDRLKRVEYHDFGDIISWYVARSLPSPEIWNFSSIGFIVPYTASGFLYVTNSGIAFLDGFITNPNATSKDRIDALKAIRNALVHTAQSDPNIKKLCCTTKNRTIESLAREVEFLKVDDYTLLSKRF